MHPRSAALVLTIVCLLASPSFAQEGNAGQADLDKATELKINAKDLQELNKVIDLLESALDKGLDEGNTEFADAMLAGSLVQRGSAMAGILLGQPSALLNPKSNPQFLQLRTLALRDLGRAVDLDPSQTDAYLLIGRLQSMPKPLGDPIAARDMLTRFIKNAKDAPDKQIAQAYALRSVTRTVGKDRLEDIGKAVELEPNKLEYLVLRAREHQRQKDYDAALADAEKAIELKPGNAAVHQLKAVILMAMDRLDEALESFNKATEIAPEDIGSYQLRSQLFDQMGDLDKALEQLDKAMAMKPGNPAPLLLRVNLLIKNQRFEQALAAIDKLLAEKPDMLQAMMIRSQLLSELGRDDQALLALEKIAEKLPNRAEIHLQLAAFYMDGQQANKAIAALSRVLELAGDNRVALQFRGDMYLSIGEHSKALLDFKRAYELNPEDHHLLNNYAWTLATSPYDELRDGPKAVEIATKACELTEYKMPHILSTLAAAFAESGDFDSAVEWSEKAVAMTEEGVEGVEGDIASELDAELASYKAKKPWRELQQVEDAPGADTEQRESPEPDNEPAPAGAIDF